MRKNPLRSLGLSHKLKIGNVGGVERLGAERLFQALAFLLLQVDFGKATQPF